MRLFTRLPKFFITFDVSVDIYTVGVHSKVAWTERLHELNRLQFSDHYGVRAGTGMAFIT